MRKPQERSQCCTSPHDIEAEGRRQLQRPPAAINLNLAVWEIVRRHLDHVQRLRAGMLTDRSKKTPATDSDSDEQNKLDVEGMAQEGISCKMASDAERVPYCP